MTDRDESRPRGWVATAHHARKEWIDGPANRGARVTPARASGRFTASLSDDENTIIGRWEIAEDRTNYTTDFDLVYRRVGT